MKRTRISRGLVGLLVVILAIGIAAYLYETGKNRSSQKQASTAVLPTETTAVVPHATPSGTATVQSSPSTKPADSMLPSNGAQLSQVTAGPKSLVTETPSTPPPPMLSAQAAPVAQPVSVAPATQPAAVQASAVIGAWSPTASVVPPAPSSSFLADASTKISAGDLLGARKMLNDALLSGHLTAADAAATKRALANVNDTVVFSDQKFPEDEYGGMYTVAPGDRLKKIAENLDVTWELLARLNGIDNPAKLRAGAKLKVIKGPFNVVVNKKAFTMDLYLGSTPGSPGSMYVRSYSVGLGRDDSTPTGTWLVEVHHKIKDPTYFSPRGEGVIDAKDPKNPLGHRWIGLTGVDGRAVGQQSYGIHGTIDPDSIGKQASMGCIRMRNEDVEVVFDLLAEGKTNVIVRD